MLDILDIAKEEGNALGLQEGKALGMVETLQEIIVDTLMEACPVLPVHLSEQIRTITNVDVLKGLHRQAIKCQNLQDFEVILQQVI